MTKKLLTFLTLLTLFFGVGWAAEVTGSIYFGRSSSDPNLVEIDAQSVTGNDNNGNTWTITTEGTTSFTNSNNAGYSQVGSSKKPASSITFTTTLPNSVNITSFSAKFGGFGDTEGDITLKVGNTIVGSGSLDGTNDVVVSSTSSAMGTVLTVTVTNIAKGVKCYYISYTYVEGSSTTYHNISYSTPTNGAFSNSNPTQAAEDDEVTIATTPNDGYLLSAVTYTPDGGSAQNATVNGNNATFTMPASNVTVAATFAAMPTYAITVTGGTASPTTAYEGQTVTVTPTIPDGKVVDQITTSPSDLTLTASGANYTFTMPNEAVTITITYKDAPTYTNVFERITDLTQLTVENGERYLLVCETSGKAHKGISDDASAIEISNHSTTLTETSDVNIFTLGQVDGKYYLEYEYNGNTYYLGHKTSSSTGDNSIQGNTNNSVLSQWTINFDEGNAIITQTANDKTYNLRAYNNDFRVYTGNSNYDVQLYKEMASIEEVGDVYIVGQVNGHDSDPWVSTEGVQLTYSNSDGTYAADIYCDGMKNGNDDGYSYFLFAKSLPFSWDNTSNLYGSGADNSYWPISGLPNESAFDEEIPLYEGSKNVYRLPAGLYTVTVDLDYTGHQYTTKSVKVTKRDVTLSVTNSATFETTKNVTMTSNLTDLGGKIWYTTDGSDPRTQSNQNRHEYTEQLTLDATTTIKAVAVLGCIYSDVVEKTYTKQPAAPVINPTSCTFNEPLTVTITAEEGATIYYTTDGSDPTDQSTQYTGSFTVSTTTTVKAIAYVGEAYSNIATATYTYSNVQPSTGDFTLVKSANDIVAGREYIIINSDRNAAASTVSGTKFSVTDDFTLSNNNETASAGTAVKVFTLENAGDNLFYLKDTEGTYYTPSSSSTDINSEKNAIYVAYDGGYVLIKNSSTASRSIGYNYQATNHVFGSYSTSPTGNQRPIYLYYRESNAVQNPVFSPVPGIYNVDVDVTISCATSGATIYYTTDNTEPSATNGTVYSDEIMVSENTTFKAIAVKDGNTSSVVTAAYTISKSTDIETVTLTYSEPFTAGIGKFTINNESGYSPVWSLDGNYGIKGTAYSPNTTPTNNAAVSRLVSPIIDMTGAVQPELTFAHQINSFFTNASEQCTLWIRETTNGTDGTWIQLPLSFQTPAQNDWSNDYADIDLSAYAGKKVQISFLYSNPVAGTGAGTWEIQHFVVADNSEYRLVNNIAEFLALENGTKAKFKNPVTVLYDYSQYSLNTYQEYIWVKDESGFTQIFLQPSLDGKYGANEYQRAYYENGDVIPAGFIVTKQYYANGGYYQAFSNQATEEDKGGFQEATQKALADPEPFTVAELANLEMTDENIATYNNRYVSVKKLKITSKSGKNFNFTNDENISTTTVGYNKYSDSGSVLKDGNTSAVVTVPAAGETYYDVTAILQKWGSVWEIMPITFTPWEEKKVTLRDLCEKGTVNETYTISNRLQCVYIREGNKLWVKDDNGQSILKKAPAEGDNNYEIGEEAGNKQLDQSLYDQSNWLEVHLADGSANAETFYRHIIKGGAITGTFTNKTNPTMVMNVVLTSTALENSGTVEYAPNYYCAANFYNGIEGGNQACMGSENHGNFFFMNPKPQEYAQIVWAQWDGTKMIVPTGEGANEHRFNGEFEVNMSMNSYPNFSPTTGKAYKFEAIVRRIESTGGNTLRANKSNDYIVYPLNLSDEVVTGINNVTGKAVAGVKYYNLAGIESDKPFEGVNIIVTTYTDGSRSSAKVLK